MSVTSPNAAKSHMHGQKGASAHISVYLSSTIRYQSHKDPLFVSRQVVRLLQGESIFLLSIIPQEY